MMNIDQPAALAHSRALYHRILRTFRKRRWQWLAALLCFGLINGFIVYQIYKDWDAVRSLNWLRFDWRYLAATAVVQFIGLLVAVYSWVFVIHKLGTRLSFRRHLKFYTLSSLARKLPGPWNLVSRVYMYNQIGGDKLQITTATLAESLIFGFSGVVLALLTLLLPGSRAGYINPLILVAVLVGFVILVLSPLFRKLLARLNKQGQDELRLRPHHLLYWVLLNTVTIALGGITLFWFCRAFGVVDQTAFVPLVQGWALTVFAGSLLAWLPADIGITSSVLMLILGSVMPAMGQAALLLVAWKIWNSLSEIVWGALGFLIKDHSL